MRTFIYTCSWIMLVITLFSCNNKTDTLFTEIPSSHSSVEFNNTIKENESYNILTYEYLYNGGGVATGDINNDGLTDIIFTGNMVPNKLYLNKGDFKFQEITGKAGIWGREKWKTGVVMADVNGDDLLDIYICYSGPGSDESRSNELYINQGVKDGIPFFKESAKEYGLDAPGTFSTSVSFFDMDNDGDLDLFLVNHADMFFNPFYNTGKLRSTRHPKFGNRLYRNDKGRFTDVSSLAHIDGSGLNFGLSVSVSDINNDGWSDLYVTNDYDERDFLYLNNHNGTFREVLTTAAQHISEFAMGSDIADFNNDEKTDVVVLDMLPEDNHRQKLLKGADTYDKYTLRTNSGFHKQQMRNTLQLNNGNDSSGIPVFSEIGQLAGISNTDWSWSPLFADFDNDGWKDLFISNGIFRDITNLDFVKYTSGYTNEATNNNKINDKHEMWKLINKMPSTKLYNYMFRNNHNLGFENVTGSWGFTEGSVNNGVSYADLDNDGDLDLVINRLNDMAAIYRNNTVEKTKKHFTRIRLKGEGKNKFGIGAKLFLRSKSGLQMKEEFTARGFQSSVDPIIHFGLGNDENIDILKVSWTGGKVSILKNIKADSLLTIYEKDAVPESDTNSLKTVSKPIFTEVSKSNGIEFDHQQALFVDFKISPLLPYQLSKTGPCIAKADVNGDGLEDVFIGGSAGYESRLFLQKKDGNFILSTCKSWNDNKNVTNTDALFFDADYDGDSDLYLVSGGADFFLNNKNYKDRFFVNDGYGNFSLDENALPSETESGSCARATDMNHDGLPDLFIGNKITPGFYPQGPQSFILKNISKPGNIRFIKDSSQSDFLASKAGMVTDAVWTDLNNDSWNDLVLVGEFMPVTIFENQKGVLRNKTSQMGLANTQGWWCRILADDFNKDGRMDLVIGNLGMNTQLKASSEQPLTITSGDFSGNGTPIPILSFYNEGESFPFFSRDEMIDQLPILNKKFLRYTDYADAKLTDLFTEEQLKRATTDTVKFFQSVCLLNEGNKFSLHPLPEYAQLSALNGIVPMDVDNNGSTDLVIAGNLFPMRVQLGPLDASIGMVLKNDGSGNFSPLTYSQTGLNIPGDVRNMISVKTRNGNLLLVAKNNGAIQLLKRKND
jgi:hypothetical protein